MAASGLFRLYLVVCVTTSVVGRSTLIDHINGDRHIRSTGFNLQAIIHSVLTETNNTLNRYCEHVAHYINGDMNGVPYTECTQYGDMYMAYTSLKPVTNVPEGDVITQEILSSLLADTMQLGYTLSRITEVGRESIQGVSCHLPVSQSACDVTCSTATHPQPQLHCDVDSKVIPKITTAISLLTTEIERATFPESFSDIDVKASDDSSHIMFYNIITMVHSMRQASASKQIIDMYITA